MNIDTPDKLAAPISRRDHHRGRLDAPAQLVEYGDFECPACGAAHPLVQALIETMGNNLCFAFRNFPLTNIHPHSEAAAESAEAAGAQGKYWEMHDMLFENQGALDFEDLAEYATTLGLDAERLINDVTSHAYDHRVREDFMTGIRSGVNGTPSFFVNGVRYDGPRDIGSMVMALSQSAA